MSDSPEDQIDLARRAMAAADRVRRIRTHPVTSLLNTVGTDTPAKHDLDALGLPDEHRRKVADATREIAAMRAGGENAEAKRHTEHLAAELIDALPAEYQRTDYQPPNPDDSPATLADQVSRW